MQYSVDRRRFHWVDSTTSSCDCCHGGLPNIKASRSCDPVMVSCQPSPRPPTLTSATALLPCLMRVIIISAQVAAVHSGMRPGVVMLTGSSTASSLGTHPAATACTAATMQTCQHTCILCNTTRQQVQHMGLQMWDRIKPRHPHPALIPLRYVNVPPSGCRCPAHLPGPAPCARAPPISLLALCTECPHPPPP